MQLDFSFLTSDILFDYILKGLIFSITLTIIATVGGLFFGTLLALMRLSPLLPIRFIAACYVNLMRSIPLVMVILWFFLLMPLGFFNIFGETGMKYRTELTAIITFVAFQAAYFCEIMRAGILAIPKGQFFAAQAVGMNYSQNMRYVILPQAFRNMIPVFLTQIIILFQDTSLVYVIGAYDLLKGFDLISKNYVRTVEAYLLAGIVYFVICYSLSAGVRRIHKKIAIIR